MMSILIPVHGQAELLEQCIQSIVRHTHTFEIWVWDNASAEGKQIEALCHRYGARYLRAEVNLGFIIPCNRLAAKARGEYICLVNSDVVVDDKWEMQAIDALKADVALIGRDARQIMHDGSTKPLNTGDVNYLEASFWVMPRATYEKYGLFDEELEFAYGEDVEYCLRLQQCGEQIKQVDLPVRHLRNRTRNSLDKRMRACLKQCWQRNLNIVLDRYKEVLV